MRQEIWEDAEEDAVEKTPIITYLYEPPPTSASALEFEAPPIDIHGVDIGGTGTSSDELPAILTEYERYKRKSKQRRLM